MTAKLKRLVNTGTHTSKAKPQKNAALMDFYEAVPAKREDRCHSTPAELTMCSFILEHIISFSAMDMLSHCILFAISDSKIASDIYSFRG